MPIYPKTLNASVADPKLHPDWNPNDFEDASEGRGNWLRNVVNAADTVFTTAVWLMQFRLDLCARINKLVPYNLVP